MSIFGSIMTKIFGSHAAAAAPVSGAAAPTPGTAPTQSTAAGGSTAAQSVDVEAILTDLAATNSQQLNWRTSIVDLMKLLNLDSSLHARQELARELRYSGDTNDSAAMNIWLHKQVMHKLEENGGKVPDDLKA
jgi:hypothetical protein